MQSTKLYFLFTSYIYSFVSAQSHDLKTALAGQIARALGVCCVDEVVVFDDGQVNQSHSHGDQFRLQHESGEASYTGNSDPNYFLAHLLSYLETPPNLRKHLFPIHPDLRTAGTLPSLDLPHHLRAHEWCQFREGVTFEDHSTDGKNNHEYQGKKRKKRKDALAPTTESTLVDAGLFHPVSVSVSIPPYTRVTLKFPMSEALSDPNESPQLAEAVSPALPREEAGYYWGYTVRCASSLSAVFTECTFPGGYDVSIGTSERGTPLSSLQSSLSDEPPIPDFRHMLIVFGGVAGLEAAVGVDKELAKVGVKEPKKLFDYWVNVYEGQGSRTIRTEEAIWLALMGFRELVLAKGIKADD